MSMSPPAAFLSYVHFDDEHEEGRITQLRHRLQGEIRIQAGWPDFTIFQDRDDIRWGQEWKVRLSEAIEAVTFFIPVVTPLYFRSEACRDELEQFLAREQALHRRDLIFPILYVDAPALTDAGKRARDPLASALASRQHADWRELRFEPLGSAIAFKTLAGLASQIRVVLERGVEESVEDRENSPREQASDIHPEQEGNLGPKSIKKIEPLQKITERYAALFKDQGIYLRPSIPDAFISNAYTSYASPALVHGEMALCLCDSTISGTGEIRLPGYE